MNLFYNRNNNKGLFAKGIAMGAVAGGLIGLSAAVFTDSQRMKEMKRISDKCIKSTKAFISNMGL
ncbi:MAG: hypothetical protein ACI4N6_05145 [Eubacteriales bacterium]